MSQHTLFHRYPLSGEATLTTGPAPTPYHVYEGHGTLIGGTADAGAVRALLQNEKLFPLETRDGRALLAVWVATFDEASLGAHNELQISLVVAHHPVGVLPRRPLTVLYALTALPEARLFCYRLWNNSEVVVAYNREVLGLPAALNHATIERRDGRKQFAFYDEGDELICEGDVAAAAQTPADAAWAMLRLLGLRRSIALWRQRYLEAQVVNPRGPVFDENRDAQTYLAPDDTVVQFFDESRDRFAFTQEPYHSLDFTPRFLEHFSPFRFVYLAPV
jgi:hypothetical protein